MTKKFLIVANWKANNLDVSGWIKQLLAFSLELRENNDVEITIAPPYAFIPTVRDLLKASSSKLPASLSSQDVSQFSEGAYTGEITAEMLTSIGTKYCLIGHSERRKYFGENNALIEKKLDQAIRNNIIPIICAQTLEEIPSNIRNFPGDKFVIMYEPMAAISTEGNYHPESPERVQSVLEDWQKKLNLNCQFLYGGSVNSKIVQDYAKIPLVSGFVVGHASLDPTEFFSIVKQCLSPNPSF